jgi:hypothetical protein
MGRSVTIGRYGHIGPLYFRIDRERWDAWIYLPKSNYNGVLMGYTAHSDEHRPDEGFLFRKRFR